MDLIAAQNSHLTGLHKELSHKGKIFSESLTFFHILNDLLFVSIFSAIKMQTIIILCFVI